MDSAVIHYPRLDTVLMIEDAIKNANNYPTKVQLWRSLRKKVMYQTFTLVLKYLESSNKIILDKDGRIIWIFANDKLRKIIARSRGVHGLSPSLREKTPAFFNKGESNRLLLPLGKMKGNSEKIVRRLRNLEGQIRRDYKAEVIGIFGSYARGEECRKSDVDLLVRFLQGASLLDLVGLSDFLEEKLGLRVDVVSERAVRKELKDAILKEVVAV